MATEFDEYRPMDVDDEWEDAMDEEDEEVGMSKEELSVIPKVIAQEGNSCAVCIEDFQEDEKVSQLSCDHQFHPQCIGSWLSIKRTCPICRQAHHQRQP